MTQSLWNTGDFLETCAHLCPSHSIVIQELRKHIPQNDLYKNDYRSFSPSKKKKNSPNWKQPTCPSTGKWINKL